MPTLDGSYKTHLLKVTRENSKQKGHYASVVFQHLHKIMNSAFIFELRKHGKI